MTDQVPNARTLAERIAEDYAPAWRPEVGDSIIGFITEISIGSSDYGDYPIVTVVQDNGVRASIHAFHTVIKDLLIEQEPSIGEEIACKYLGRTLPKNYAPTGKMVKATEAEQLKADGYENYRTLVNRAPADLWEKFSKSPSRRTKVSE